MIRGSQDEEAGYEPDRQRRVAVAARTDFTRSSVAETPVDLPGQPKQRVAQVDNLVQRRPEENRRPVIPRARHPPSPDTETSGEPNHRSPKTGNPNHNKAGLPGPLSCKTHYFAEPRNPNRSICYRLFMDNLLRFDEQAPTGELRRAEGRCQYSRPPP